MVKALSGSNYEILSITKGDKEINLQGKTTSFDYYESVLSPNVTANLTVKDGGNAVKYDKKFDRQERVGSIYNALPITGGEEIGFKIRNSLGVLDFSRNPLMVNGASNMAHDDMTNNILINLVSPLSKLNQDSVVYKKYDGNIGDNVKKIIKEYLKVNDNKMTIDDVVNSYSFIGNSDSVFDVICWLGAKSISVLNGVGFFFYETQDGLNYRGIENLIDQDATAFYYKTGAARKNIDNNANDYKILSSSIEKNQNIINAMKSGTYHTRSIFFNPKNFDLEEIFSRFGKDRQLTPSKILGKEVEEPEISAGEDKFNRTLYDILDLGAYNPTVAGEDNNDPTQWQTQSTARYNILFSQKLKLQVPCNPNLKAGDVISCDFPIVTEDSKDQGANDPVQSGRYLIVDLCHHFDPTRSITSMTLVRDSYGVYTKKQ